MHIRHRGFEPEINASAFVAPTTVLVGKVLVGPRSGILYGAVLDSEASSVTVGECTIISENAVIRATASGDEDHPVAIADHVFIGPHTTLLGCLADACSFMATGAILMTKSLNRQGFPEVK